MNTTSICLALALFGFGDDTSAPSARSELSAPVQESDKPLDPGRIAANRALTAGLEYLAQRQATVPDGSLPANGAESAAPVGVTALAAVAWMAGGSTLERGPHGEAVSKAIEYLMTRVNVDGDSPHHGFVSEAGDNLSKMHGHGFATLAFAQAYTVSPGTPLGERLGRSLKLAIRRIEDSQHPDGGWGYGPVPSLEHEGSITITVVQALRAAKNVGLEVDLDVIARAIDYVAKSQNEDGSFRYSLRKEDKSTVALTAACISTLNATGDYSSSVIQAGYDFIFRELEQRLSQPAEAHAIRWPHYERLYLAQAFWQHSDAKVFRRWVRTERVRVLSTQNEDGSWGASEFGDCYATAMNCLFLALPESLLPIFQR